VLWLDGDVGITLNAANVSAWKDQSVTGANLVQATGANQPKFVSGAVNGHGAVQPNDANDNLVDATKPDLSSVAGYTSFIVFKATDTSTSQLVFKVGPTNASDAMQFNGGNLYRFVGSANNGLYAFTDTTSYHISEALFDGSQSGNANRLKSYLDGTAQTLTFTGTIPATTPSGDAGSQEGHASVASLAFVASLIVYNRALGSAERSLVGRYLASRFNLATTY
jgi:hypothetical protein